MADAMDELVGKLKIVLTEGPTPQEITTFTTYLCQIGVEAPQYASVHHVAEDIMTHLYNINPIRQHAARVVNEFEQTKS